MDLYGQASNMILTETQTRNHLAAAGFTGQDLNRAVEIAFCESDFNVLAHNTVGEDSRGLMQINIEAHPIYSSLDLFDPTINSLVAYQIYLDSGSNFNSWTCDRILKEKQKTQVLLLGLALIGGIVLYYV